MIYMDISKNSNYMYNVNDNYDNDNKYDYDSESEKKSESEKESLDNDEKTYTLITKNVSKKISELFGIPENKYDDEQIDWEPPKTHGLSNSERIIPSYYIHPTKKILDIDYYEIIKDDIRNLRKLNQYQLYYIENLPHKYKNEIIHIFNDCLKSIEILLDT